jgi:hypothetical protein
MREQETGLKQKYNACTNAGQEEHSTADIRNKRIAGHELAFEDSHEVLYQVTCLLLLNSASVVFFERICKVLFDRRLDACSVACHCSAL